MKFYYIKYYIDCVPILANFKFRYPETILVEGKISQKWLRMSINVRFYSVNEINIL